MKVRVTPPGTIGKSYLIDPDATVGAQIGVNLLMPDGSVATLAKLQGSTTTDPQLNGLTRTIWTLIGGIPANVTALAGLATSGIVVRKSDSTIVTVTIAAGASNLLGVTHGDGTGGAPTVDFAALSARSIIANATNTSAVPSALQASGDKAVLHQSGTALAFSTVDSTYVSDFTEAAQDAVGTSLTNTATVTFTYNDGSNTISAAVNASATLDTISSTRGTILYRGASGWVALAPGTSGNLLKTNGAGADPAWTSPPSSSPLTTKGDLYGFDTANNRIPVGTDGQILTADSTQTLGVKWAANAASGALAYVNTSVPAGNTVANTVTETAFTSSYTMAAGSLAVGSVIRIRLFGVSSTAALAPTLRTKIKLGTTLMLDTGAISPLLGSEANAGWSLDALLVVQSTGATGTIEAQGVLVFSTGAAASAVVSVDNTGPITIDTTASQAITATVQWGTASTSNTTTLREMAVWIEQAAIPSVSLVNVTPDTHPTVPNAADDEFEFGTTVDTTGARRTGANAWTWVNQSTATGVVGQGALALTAPTTGAATNNLRIIQQTAAASPWEYRAKCGGRGSANFHAFGMVVGNNSSGKYVVLGGLVNTTPGHIVQEYTSVTVSSTALYSGTADTPFYGALQQSIYLSIKYDGTTITFSMSPTGVDGTFISVATVASATFPGTPDRIGLFANSANATLASALSCDWFRRWS